MSRQAKRIMVSCIPPVVFSLLVSPWFLVMFIVPIVATFQWITARR